MSVRSSGVLALGLVLLLAACGEEPGETPAGPDDDAGVAEAERPPPDSAVAPLADPAIIPPPDMSRPDPAIVPPPEPVVAAEEEEPAVPVLATEDPPLAAEFAAMIESADILAGRTYLQRCAGCHEVDPATQGQGAAQIGPPLADVVGRLIGGVAGFGYSTVFETMRETGAVWTVARLDIFLADPAAAAPGTAMSVEGVSAAQDRANIIAFLQELAGVEAANQGDPELLTRIAAADPDEGQALAARCSGCHRFEAGVAPLIGPNLFDVIGMPVGRAAGFNYSPALRALNAEGATWTYGRLDAFLESPATAIPGTRMGFAGIGDPDQRAAIIAYLRMLSPEPPPVFAAAEPVGNELAGLAPLEFDAAQADRGGDYYEDLCAACHRSDLRGEIDMRDDGFGIAPPLAGPNFVLHWYRGTLYDLVAYLEERKPPGNPGALEAQAYVDIVTYLLARNGFAPGGRMLTPDRGLLDAMGFYQ